jgi:hypothetical protein
VMEPDAAAGAVERVRHNEMLAWLKTYNPGIYRRFQDRAMGERQLREWFRQLDSGAFPNSRPARRGDPCHVSSPPPPAFFVCRHHTPVSCPDLVPMCGGSWNSQLLAVTVGMWVLRVVAMIVKLQCVPPKG